MLAIALGFFDGVHRGHAALLRRVAETAAARGLEASALTFTRHPSELLGRPRLLINSLQDRLTLIERRGVRPIVLDFNETLMNAEPLQFLHFLHDELNVSHLAAGYDFRFGREGAGDCETLGTFALQLGMTSEILPEVTHSGERVSSSAIRKLIAEGNIRDANDMLGHAHILSGRVAAGQGIARKLGIPTANIPVEQNVLCPKFGVYKTRVTMRGTTYLAVTNIGVRPTVERAHEIGAARAVPTVETHILDFNYECYGEHLTLELLCFMRPEQKFDSLDALTRRVRSDIETVRESGMDAIPCCTD